LANYLISRNVSTAIIPNEHFGRNQDDIEEDGQVNILEETSSQSPSSPLKIKMEPQLPEIIDEHPNYENHLVDSLLEEFKEEMVDCNDHDQDDENANQDIADKHVKEDDKLDWEPGDKINADDDEDEGSVAEVEGGGDYDKLEKNNGLTMGNEDDLMEKGPETGTPCKVNQLPKVKNKGPLSSSSSPKRRSSKYIKKGRKYTVLRTADGKFKCRHCDQSKLTSY